MEKELTIYLLFITLIIEFICAYFLSDNIIVAPACVFSAVFIVATADLIRNIDYWDVNIHWNTYFVIAGGILAFIIGSYLTKRIFHKSEKFSVSTLENQRRGYLFRSLCGVKLFISNDIKCYLILVYNIVTLILFYLAECKISGLTIGANGLSSLVSSFRYISLRSSDYALPTYVNYMLVLMYAGGLIWLYLVIKEIFNNKKFDIVMCFNIILVLTAYFMAGSRGKMIYLLLGGIPIFYFLWCEKKGCIQTLEKKYIIDILFILLLFILLFRTTANLMGRTITLDFAQHISVNLSAPILNLDTFLQEQWSTPSVWGHNTFRNFISILGAHLGIKNWVYNIDNPFRYVNGHPLGNVSTTFYAFYYDFKYLGVFLLTSLMGVISQLSFEWCCNSIHKNTSIKYSYILYAEIFTCIAFSFFSNKFYEILFTFSFMETLVCWAIIIWFMTKVKIYIHRY